MSNGVTDEKICDNAKTFLFIKEKVQKIVFYCWIVTDCNITHNPEIFCKKKTFERDFIMFGKNNIVK